MQLYNPHLNWEVIVILLGILSMTPHSVCVCVCYVLVLCMHVRKVMFFFLYIACLHELQGRGKKQLLRLTREEELPVINLYSGHLCSEKLTLLPAHHSYCWVVNCACKVCWCYVLVLQRREPVQVPAVYSIYCTLFLICMLYKCVCAFDHCITNAVTMQTGHKYLKVLY